MNIIIVGVRIIEDSDNRGSDNRGCTVLLKKWFPLQGERAQSLYFWSFQKQNREEGGQNNNNRPINLLKVLTFPTDYKYST